MRDLYYIINSNHDVSTNLNIVLAHYQSLIYYNPSLIWLKHLNIPQGLIHAVKTVL